MDAGDTNQRPHAHAHTHTHAGTFQRPPVYVREAQLSPGQHRDDGKEGLLRHPNPVLRDEAEVYEFVEACCASVAEPRAI